MEKVVRYECSHCKKLFKIDRHFCFKNPENKACTTCKHYAGVETNMAEDGSTYRSWLCSYDGESWIIHYELGEGETPFRNHHGNRGYNCDWWEIRTKNNEEIRNDTH